VNSSTPKQLYDQLYAAYGPQHWWPAETVVGMMAGAILVQNTAWTQAAKAVESLDANGCLSWQSLQAVDDETLWELIRPAGYFRVKSKRLKALARFMVGYDDLEQLFNLPTTELRRQLLTVNGVGKETADSIICYGAKQPIFVVDAYTYRLFSRLGWVGEESSYDEMQSLVHGGMEMESDLLGEYHALIVCHAKERCRVRPLCAGCPISFCPQSPSQEEL
jgi:endonuclease III related protein